MPVELNSFEKGRIMTDKIKDYFIISMFALGVIVLRVFYITRTSGPFIYADEFGYWAHAAHMAGQTWAGVMDGVSWYSFGYSFWLALTFLFSDQMEVMYHIAIGINILMSMGIFALAYRIVRKLANGQSVFLCGFIALAVTSFPTYIFYSYTTMAETLVVLVIWILFYEMISLEENPTWLKGALLGITAGYAFMVHNRMLTAVLAVAVCLTALWIMHRIDWRVLAAFAVSFLLMIAIYSFIKGYLDSLIMANQTVEETGIGVTRGGYNTLTYMINKFGRVFRPEKFVGLLLNTCGQLWQFLSATYLLAGGGIVYGVLCLKKNIASRQHLCIYAYPMTALLISVGMTAVATLGSLKNVGGKVRIDLLFFGRYNECYYSMLIMLGLIALCTEELRCVLKTYLGIILVYLVMSVVIFFRTRGIENGYLNIVSAVSIHIFHWLGEFGVWKCCLIALLGGGVIVGLCQFRRLGKLGCYAGLLVLIFLFSTTALYCMRTSIRGENDYTNQYTPLYDYLNQNTAQGDIVYTCGENKPAFDLQTRLVNKAVICTVPERLNEVSVGTYVVIREDQMEDMNVTDYDVCAECNEFLVLKLK